MSVADRDGTELTQADLTAMLEYFWHPVATLAELEASPTGVIGSRLLGRDLAVARLGGGRHAAMLDRCPHRSTRLSVGRVDRGAIRCAYHGWRWEPGGRCVEIPCAPGTAVPERFAQEAFETAAEHGMLWVRLRPGAPTTVPPMPAAGDPDMRVVAGEPYEWPTAAARRVENFVDLAHFAWVHDGTLGRRDQPVPPVPELRREDGELRFEYQPPDLDEQAATALVGRSDYRMPMPLTVDIRFDIAGRAGVRRHLWMTAAPVDPGVSRSYWTVARNDDRDLPDEPYLEFQRVVLAEDEPVVCNQVPAEMPLAMTDELHVRADRVSVDYRRWLIELTGAARSGPDALARCLSRTPAQGKRRAP